MATYTILGGDQKQYGSVTEEQLHQWIREGRANAQTRVQAEGSAAWTTLGELPGFQASLAGAALSTPPPLSSSVPGAAPAKTSGMAVTSLVLGILGLFSCGITALGGLVLGIVAMVRIRNSQGKLQGGGLALAGTIVSGIFLFMMPIFAAMLLPALAAAKQKAMTIKCVNNERQLALALVMYSSSHTNQLPPAATWCDAIGASPNILKCPAVNSMSSANRCDYAFNARLGGMDVSKANRQTVMLFESDGGWNANGGRELLPASPRHMGGRTYVVAFVDGHVETVNQTRLNALRWDP